MKITKKQKEFISEQLTNMIMTCNPAMDYGVNIWKEAQKELLLEIIENFEEGCVSDDIYDDLKHRLKKTYE